MKKGGFWNVYKIIAGILIILAILLLAYVEKALLTYEKAQPENVIENELEHLKKNVATDNIGESLNLSEMSDEDALRYRTKLKKAGKWDYKLLSGSYSEEEQTYGFYADDELVAKATLDCTSSKVLMVILTVNDWKLQKLTPVADDLQSASLSPTPAPGKTLTTSPSPSEIVINKYRYTFILPEEYVVKHDDEVLSGETTDGSTKYVVDLTDTDPVFSVTDSYGYSVDYAFGEQLTYYDIFVRVPSNFELSLENVDTSKYVTKRELLEEYQYCKDYASMPQLLTYEFPKSLTHPEFEITDNLGASIAYEYNGEEITITEQSKLAEVPTEIADTSELLKIAQMWSLFLTRDVYKYDVDTGKYNDNAEEPSDKGLGMIRKVLVPDSYLESVARSYARSVDITFISRHTLPSPAFVNEKVQNFVMYSDDFFSCEISFEKIMLRTNGKEYLINGRRDRMNCVCYFLRDTGSDGSDGTWAWRLAELRDLIDDEETEETHEN